MIFYKGQYHPKSYFLANILGKKLKIFGGFAPTSPNQSLDPPFFSLDKEIPQYSNVKSSRDLTVEYPLRQTRNVTV